MAGGTAQPYLCLCWVWELWQHPRAGSMLLATSFCTLSCDLVGEWLDLVYTELPGLNPKQLQGSDQKAQPCGASRQNCLLGVVPAGQVTWRAPCCPSWIKLGQEVSRSLLSYILTAADHLSTRQLHLSSRVKTLSLKHQLRSIWRPAEVLPMNSGQVTKLRARPWLRSALVTAGRDT